MWVTKKYTPESSSCKWRNTRSLSVVVVFCFLFFFLILKSVCLTAGIIISTFCRRVCGLMLCKEIVEKGNRGEEETKLKLTFSESSTTWLFKIKNFSKFYCVCMCLSLCIYMYICISSMTLPHKHLPLE